MWSGKNTLVCSNNAYHINAIWDDINKRIWVLDYDFKDSLSFGQFLHRKAKDTKAQKIIIPAKLKDVDALKKLGYKPEGTVEGFLNGDTVCFMAAYPEPSRYISTDLPAKMELLNKILVMPAKPPGQLPPGYSMRLANPDDASPLAELFRQVFVTYPTPLDQTEYVLSSIQSGVPFIIATHHDTIVSCASAEIDRNNNNAEMTNCATLEQHHGLGLMSILLHTLEQYITKMGYKCLYSLARSSEFGINLIFYRLSYHYRGTLVNNCHICGKWEDMHLWVKYHNKTQ